MSDLLETKPLLQSGVSKELWELYETDRKAFTAGVREHFRNGYPGWKIVKVDVEKRRIYLRDERS